MIDVDHSFECYAIRGLFDNVKFFKELIWLWNIVVFVLKLVVGISIYLVGVISVLLVAMKKYWGTCAIANTIILNSICYHSMLLYTTRGF